jgi:hypothetical protein
MNRADLQAISDLRLKEATALLTGGHYEGAYYLLGYAVECALKACIAKQIKEHDFPDKQLILDSYTHNLEKLLNISGLRSEFDRRIKSDKPFEVNWSTVKDWHEGTRYSVQIAEIRVRDLNSAVTDPATGILPWLTTQW